MHTPLALPAQSGFRSDLRGLSTEVITTLAGLAAAITVVALNVCLQRYLDLDFLGLTYAFILPAGAIFGGLGAAGGYYVAARITNTLPSRRMLFEMLAIGFSTWLLMHWFEYATLRFANGTLVRDSLPFWDYLQLRTEHLRLTIENTAGRNTGTTPELGLLGYLHELLQVAGFLVGGFLVWAALKSREACARCSRYARTRKLLQRVTTAVFEEVLRRAEVQLPDFANRVREKAGKHRLVGMSLSIASCPRCRRQWVRPGVVLLQGNHPVAMRLNAYELTAAQAAALQLAAPAKAA
jgi:hypothetical protein